MFREVRMPFQYGDCDNGSKREELWFDSMQKQHVFYNTKLPAL
jgi:hypothetical protein